MTDTDPRITRLDDRSLLVLDDDNALRTRLGRALESRGFEVTTAASIAEAQTALGERVPAFAVLDMRLEDGNGLKIVEAIRMLLWAARLAEVTSIMDLIAFTEESPRNRCLIWPSAALIDWTDTRSPNVKSPDPAFTNRLASGTVSSSSCPTTAPPRPRNVR